MQVREQDVGLQREPGPDRPDEFLPFVRPSAALGQKAFFLELLHGEGNVSKQVHRDKQGPDKAKGSVLHFTDTPRPKTDATERVPPWLNPMEGHGPSWPQIRLIAKLAIEVPLVEVQSWSTFADLGAEVREVANIIAAEFEKLCVVDDPIAVNQVVSQVGKLAQFVCQGRADQAMLPCF